MFCDDCDETAIVACEESEGRRLRGGDTVLALCRTHLAELRASAVTERYGLTLRGLPGATIEDLFGSDLPRMRGQEAKERDERRCVALLNEAARLETRALDLKREAEICAQRAEFNGAFYTGDEVHRLCVLREEEEAIHAKCRSRAKKEPAR